MKSIAKNIKWTETLRGERFINIVFEELAVYSGKVVNCDFVNVEFKHSSLGSSTTYKNCTFTGCTFVGKYTTLGSSTDYVSCTFTDCSFKGTMLFMGSIFKHCSLSGKMINNIFINEERFLRKPFKFEDCDLSKVELENISFNGSRFFKSTKLPENSVRVFKNNNDELIDAALNRLTEVETGDRKLLEIIFDKKLRSGFNPFILDVSLLHGFLKNESKTLFEEIVKDYEIVDN